MDTYFKIVGLRDYDFTGKDGNHVSGKNIYYTYVNKNITGEGAGKLNISSYSSCEIVGSLAIGSYIDIRYNQFGNPIKITVVEVENF